MIRESVILYLRNLINLFSDNEIFIDVESNNVSDIYLSYSSCNIRNYSDTTSTLYDDYEVEYNSSADIQSPKSDCYDDGPDASCDADSVGTSEYNTSDAHTVISVIENVRRLFIVGIPGSGKTTILRYLTLKYAKSYLAEESDILPVYIQLSEMHGESFLTSKISSLINTLSVANNFNTGNVILMLDGLNEVSTSIYDSLVGEIKHLLEKYTEISIVITSRKFGFKNSTDLPVYEVHEFSENNIKDFIVRNTNSDDLYKAIMQDALLSELVSNPLLLSMVTNVWIKEGVLPVKRSDLYELFIKYQLEKTWSLLPDRHIIDKSEIIRLLSQIAFSMRFSGFISEGLDNFRLLLSEYVSSDNLDKVCNILVRTGLLRMEAISSDCKYISFMHETFQEYFAALYVAKKYLDTGVIDVDLQNYNWRESLELIVEIIEAKLDSKNFEIFLNRLASFLNTSSGLTSSCEICMRLPLLVEACNGVMQTNMLCKEWIGQYILYNMHNYMQMSEENRTDDLFELIANAILRYKSGTIYRLLFRDIKWLKEWLYKEEELEEVLFHQEPGSKYRILLELILNSEIRTYVLDEIQHLRDEYDCLHVLCMRLKKIYDLIYKNLSSKDFRDLYRKTNDTNYLFMTLNPSFVEKQLQLLDSPDYSGYEVMLLHGNKECIEYCFEHIIPKYLLPKGEILDDTLLEHVIRQYPSLFEVILKSGCVNDRKLMEICYEIPGELLPESYYTYLKYNSSSDPQASTPLISDVEKTVDYTIKIEPLKKLSLLSVLHHVALSVGLSKKKAKKYLSETFGKQIVLDTVNIITYKMLEIENISPAYMTGALVLESLEYVDGVSYKVKGDILEMYISKDAPSEFNSNKQIFAVVFNDRYFNLDYLSKRTSFTTSLYSEIDEEFTVEMNLLQSQINIEEIKNNWYYYRFEDIATVLAKDFTGFSAKDTLKLGVIGFLPSLIKGLSKIEYGVVRSVMGNKVMVCFLHSQEVRVLKHKFEFFKPGDIIVYYNEELYAKLHVSERLPEFGYTLGKVAFSYNTNVFIVSNTDGNRYYYYDKESRIKVGETVSFFPSINGSKRHRTSLTAYNVKRLASSST